MKSETGSGIAWFVGGILTGYLAAPVLFLLWVWVFLGTVTAGGEDAGWTLPVLAVATILGLLLFFAAIPASVAMGARGIVKVFPRTSTFGHPALWAGTAVAIVGIGFILPPVLLFWPLPVPVGVWVSAALLVAAFARFANNATAGQPPPPPSAFPPPPPSWFQPPPPPGAGGSASNLPAAYPPAPPPLSRDASF